MSRAPEAKAYDKARINYEAEVNQTERRQKLVDKWNEKNRSIYGNTPTTPPPAHVWKAMKETSSFNPKTAYNKVSEADKALGNRMKDEYVEMRRGGLPREVSDDIARTHNYKYDDAYYRDAAREKYERYRDRSQN